MILRISARPLICLALLMAGFQAFAGDSATLVSVSITNNTVMAPGTLFTQTWTMSNNGTTAWTAGASGYTMNMISKDSLGAIPPTNNGSSASYPPSAEIGGGASVPPGALATFSMTFIAPQSVGTYNDSFQLNSSSSTFFGPTNYVQIVVQQAGISTYDRARAVSYANNYAPYIVSDGYFWTDGSDYYYYGTNSVPVPTSFIGDDCAHFCSCCIGSEPHLKGGGLKIASRVPPTYGEPGAQRLIYTNLIGAGLAVEVSSLDQLEPGDLIGWNWEENTNTADIDHVTFYVGNGMIASHAASCLDVSATTWYSDYARHLIHILDASKMPPLPPAPELVANAGYGLVTLNWASCTNAAGYTVARLSDYGVVLTNITTTATNYTDTGLSNGTTYYYIVEAANLAGSSYSDWVSATPMAPAPGTWQAAIAAYGPLAYWPLDETNGTIAVDPVGGHNGTYIGGVTLGQPGAALPGFGSRSLSALFDGTSGYVDVPEGPFNITGAITVMAWVNLPANPSHVSGVLGQGDTSWRMIVTTNGNPDACEASCGDATSPASIPGTGWHMMAYTCSGVSGAASNGTLYVDGAPAACDTVTTSPAGSIYDVWIGGSPDYGTARLFAGNMAHAAVFATNLSAAQILALYNAGLTIPLTVSRAGAGSLTLTWSQGTLLQSTNLAGPWTTNPAPSPLLVLPTNPQMYFKVLVN